MRRSHPSHFIPNTPFKQSGFQPGPQVNWQLMTMGCCISPAMQQPPNCPTNPVAMGTKSTGNGLKAKTKVLQKGCFSTHPLQQSQFRQEETRKAAAVGAGPSCPVANEGLFWEHSFLAAQDSWCPNLTAPGDTIHLKSLNLSPAELHCSSP